MKTSFYFLFWILIYPVLGLLNNSFINDNSFVVALILVILLSRILNKMMPDIQAYDNALSKATILEDIYTGNLKSFKKRIIVSAIVETVSAVYFLCTVLLIVLNSTIKDMDWVGVSFFGLFTFVTISRSITLFNTKSKLDEDPTTETCSKIADSIYNLDYSSYYEYRSTNTLKEIFSDEMPKYYNAFRIFSFVVAVVVSLLGMCGIINGILIFTNNYFAPITLVSVFILYGSLALYFGVKDTISCISIKNMLISKK